VNSRQIAFSIVAGLIEPDCMADIIQNSGLVHSGDEDLYAEVEAILLDMRHEFVERAELGDGGAVVIAEGKDEDLLSELARADILKNERG
jgi:hypothetical protein